MIPLVMIVGALVTAGAAGNTCHAVAGDRITAADLAAVLPAFAAVAPGAVVGFSPQPGAYRTVEPVELTRFAAANGMEYHGLQTVCFEPALTALDPTEILSAIRESLNGIAITNANINLIDYSKFRVPPGKLLFPIDSLPTYSTANTAIWNGFVERDNRRYPIWARVRMTTPQTRVVAATDLRAGQRLDPGAVRLEEAAVFPTRIAALQSLEDASGQAAKRFLRAGSPVSAADLMEANDVDRGDTVVVQVQSGGATLALEAQAEASGRRGQNIALRNSASGKIFHAKITGKGHALLDCRPSGNEK